MANIIEHISLSSLSENLYSWYINCRDLLVDFREVDFVATEEDLYIEFKDKKCYSSKIYFKKDTNKFKNPEVLHAIRQFCKIIGVPFNFFLNSLPSMKVDIFKIWQVSVTEDESKALKILKIRESPGCTIIRAIVPIFKQFIPYYEITQIIDQILNRISENSYKIVTLYGTMKDDLIFHIRIISDKRYFYNDTLYIGFSITASDLDFCPLSIDTFLNIPEKKTDIICNYAGGSYYQSDKKGIQADTLRDILPRIIQNLDRNMPDIVSRLDVIPENEDSHFNPEIEVVKIGKYKGMTKLIKKAFYSKVVEQSFNMGDSWNFIMQLGEVSKEFDILKRNEIEKVFGKYLNLTFISGKIKNYL